MPIDYEHPDEIVLGKDLKPGDCVRSRTWEHNKNGNDIGIIISTTCVLDKRGKKLKGFYEDKPAYEMYDINCPCDGAFSTQLDLEAEFKVIRARKDILYTYTTIEHQLMTRSVDLMNSRNRLMDIKEVAIDKMNDRCDYITKRIKKGE